MKYILDGAVKILYNREKNWMEAYMPNGDMIPNQVSLSIMDGVGRKGQPTLMKAVITVYCDLSDLHFSGKNDVLVKLYDQVDIPEGWPAEFADIWVGHRRYLLEEFKDVFTVDQEKFMIAVLYERCSGDYEIAKQSIDHCHLNKKRFINPFKLRISSLNEAKPTSQE